MTKFSFVVVMLSVAIFSGCSPTPAEPPITITAVELDKAYQDNPTSADEKFGGKTVVVTGVVERVGSRLKGDRTRNWWVILKVDSKDESSRPNEMQCNLTEGESLSPEPKSGQSVRIAGKVRGLSDFGDVILDGCKVD